MTYDGSEIGIVPKSLRRLVLVQAGLAPFFICTCGLYPFGEIPFSGFHVVVWLFRFFLGINARFVMLTRAVYWLFIRR